MKAAVTEAPRAMRVTDVPDADEPGDGEVLVRPEAVGLCGSDFHYFLGDIGTIDDPSSLYPRVQGHEAAGTILAVGPDCPPELRSGERVALWPVSSCGRCYACRVGRGNACANISLIGVHRDGALQEQLVVPAAQVFLLNTAVDGPTMEALRDATWLDPTHLVAFYLRMAMGGPARIEGLVPGPHTACAVPLPVDPNDPSSMQRAMGMVESLPMRCQPVTVGAAPAEQTIELRMLR